MLATFIDEFFMKDKAFSALMGMMICFLKGPFIVILIHSLGLLCPLTILFTWSTLFALREGNASLIFKTSDVFAKGLVAWAYDFPGLLLGVLFSSKRFFDWKYLGMVLISFFCQDRWRWTLFYFSFSFLFYFSFFFLFNFLFLEQLGLGFISHTVTSVKNWWCSHKTDHGTQKNGVEGSGIKWRHTTWTTHIGLMSYTWSFRVGCTVVSTDHE